MARVFDCNYKKKDNSLIEAIAFLRTDICPNCKAQRLELYSFNGYPQNYSEAVTEYLKGNEIQYNKYEIRTMKCGSCHKEFVINWMDGFPTPLTDTFFTNIFLHQFINHK